MAKSPETLRNIAMDHLMSLGATDVISGMALGWDTIVAEAALSLGLPLTAAVPFEGQESGWPREAQKHYRDLLKQAKSVVVVSPGDYEAYKFHVRNQWMVNNSSKLLALWSGERGGTKNCIDYAKCLHRHIINVWNEAHAACLEQAN